jgi:uncharacterized protein with HEPN domain
MDKNSYLADEAAKRVSAMPLINIGELVVNLSDETKQIHSDVPWKVISATRHKVAHHYIA